MAQLTPKVIKAFAKTIVGDNRQAPYVSGPELVDFFNEFGFDDEYSRGGGFPTRWVYAESKIKLLNGTARIEDLLVETVNPLRFVDTEFNYLDTISFLNEYLKFNKLEIVADQETIYVKELGKAAVTFSNPLKPSTSNINEFIDQQMRKCDKKLSEGDYDGAITNARSLVESVFYDLECRLSVRAPKKDGDLPKMFKRLKSMMNMNEKIFEGKNAVLQIIGGLTSAVNGIATMSNDMGDRHARKNTPLKHHAVLCVNTAKTLSSFIVSSFIHQTECGTIKCSNSNTINMHLKDSSDK
ncbi:MAG: hypothetical protein PWQ57_1501 [Desulfovibrionales bacterium]|jgi:hypothetical protein|nr:hypothetical protein [Desulfovibrionales bacterium]